MNEYQLLENALSAIAGLDKEAFELSRPYWKLKTYKKGEFYNEYQNVCKHLGFIINGIFRIYRADEKTGEEKNMLFYSEGHFVASYNSFINQTACDYYTAAVKDSLIVYIHIDHLRKLYTQSHSWERFGRKIAESAYHQVLTNTEGFLFKSAEERYIEMLNLHPDIFNAVPLYHIASYLGIQGPSLSRIRKRMVAK